MAPAIFFRQHIRSNAAALLQPSAIVFPAALLLSWLAILFLTNPFGDFPLNDDWAWYMDVKNFLDGGPLYTGWESMTLISQILWGAFVAKIFGLSYNTLRFSCMFLMLIEILYFYKIITEISSDRTIAALLAFLLLLNPINMSLSHTFMTDIPFLAITMVTIYLFLKSLKYDNKVYVWLGLALSIISVMLRQFAILFPLFFSVAYLYRYGLSRRRLLTSLFVGLSCIIVLIIYEHYLRVSGIIPKMYSFKQAGVWALLSGNIVEIVSMGIARMVVFSIYIGFFLFPLIAFRYLEMFRNSSLALAPILGAALLRLLGSISGGYSAPLMSNIGNILTPQGIGPFLLKDIGILGLDNYPRIPQNILDICTDIGVAGALGLIAILWRRIAALISRPKPDFNNAVVVMAGLATLAYSVIIALLCVFDRYLLVPFALISMLCLVGSTKKILPRHIGLFLAYILLIGWFSVASTHDYMAWNRARWQALAYLSSDLGVKPTRIDGGFEFNGQRLYNPDYATSPGKSWWWVDSDEYVVAFGRIPDYTVIARFPYRRMLFNDTGEILALRHNGVGKTAAGSDTEREFDQTGKGG